MGERYVRIVEVVGSSPICSTIKPRWFTSGAFWLWVFLWGGPASRRPVVGCPALGSRVAGLRAELCLGDAEDRRFLPTAWGPTGSVPRRLTLAPMHGGA